MDFSFKFPNSLSFSRSLRNLESSLLEFDSLLYEKNVSFCRLQVTFSHIAVFSRSIDFLKQGSEIEKSWKFSFLSFSEKNHFSFGEWLFIDGRWLVCFLIKSVTDWFNLNWPSWVFKSWFRSRVNEAKKVLNNENVHLWILNLDNKRRRRNLILKFIQLLYTTKVKLETYVKK